MPNLKEISIKTYKKYLIISRSSDFLQNAKNLIEEKLNISDVSDNKTWKNNMTFSTIIFKDGGFVKFSLYDNDLLSVCPYDVLLVDKALFVEKFIDINKFCILSDVKCIDMDLTIDINIEGKCSNAIENREYDTVLYMDYGNCPYCGLLVREIDNTCPGCGEILDWAYTKDIILKRCKYHLDHPDGHVCNTYAMMLKAFDFGELMIMPENEVVNIHRFGLLYKKYFLDHIIENPTV